MMAIPQSVNESKDNCTRVGPRGRHEGGMMAITQRHPSGWWTVGRHEGEVIAIPVSVNETARTLVHALADSDATRAANATVSVYRREVI